MKLSEINFAELPKEARDKFLEVLNAEIELDIARGTVENIQKYASSTDEFVRRNTYLVLGRIYSTHFDLKEKVYIQVDKLLREANSQVRETAVLAFGEIVKLDPRKAVGMIGNLRPSDLLWLPKEVLEQVRKLGGKLF